MLYMGGNAMNDRFRISRKEQIVPSEEKDKFTNNEKIYNTLNKYGIKQKDIADIERNF
ncbi:hypothetical protein IJU97_05600 [bacterium]|nr:hypothetical protein [bacterium]